MKQHWNHLFLPLLLFLFTMTSPTTASTSPAEQSCNIAETPLGYDDSIQEPRMFDAQREQEGCLKIIEALTPEELSIMPDANLPLRHFRADKGNTTKAIKRITYALQWRKEFGVQHILKSATNPETEEEKATYAILKKESSPGKMYVRNHDKEGRAILYMYPVRENSNNHNDNIKHLVYSLERVIACTEKNKKEKIVMVMDFTNWSMRHNPPMKTTKETIHILQECYVERLERVYITNAPLLFRTFWNMVKPFIDPVTKQKIVFASGAAGMEQLKLHLDEKLVEKEAGGVSDLRPFDVDEYYDTPFDQTFDEMN